MEESLSFAPLLLVIFLAFIVPVVLSRFKRLTLPIVVGEIAAGIIVGRSGLAWVTHDPVLDLLAEFGFVFLMFLSGMEIDFSSLSFPQIRHLEIKRPSWGPLQIGGVVFTLTLILSTAIGFVFTQMELVQNPWMMSLILSTTSLGVVLPVLKEEGLANGRFGQTLLIAALIADFVTMLLITIFVTLLSHGLTLEILLVGVLFVAFIFMYRFGLFFFNRIPGVRRMFEEMSGATSQLKVRAAFTLMLTFVVLSEVLGAEVILGAFLAGAIISLLRTPQDAEMTHQLEAIGFGFFIPIFFIMVGVDFDLRALLSSSQALLLLPLLLGAAYLVKSAPALFFHVQFSWRETIAAGALLSSRLSLVIAESAIGLRLGLITEEVNAAIILVAVVTVTVSPILFTRTFSAEERPSARPILVVGANRFGLQVTEHLRAHHERVVLIESDPARAEAARQRSIEVVAGRVAPVDESVAPYLNEAKTMICALSDVEEKYETCRVARTTFGLERVITMLADPGEYPRFTQLGVKTVSVDLDWPTFVALFARNPAAYELLTRADDNKEVLEIVMRNPWLADRPLRQLVLPGDVRLLTLRRNGELIMPGGDTRLQEGDVLSLVGAESCLEEARRIFRGNFPIPDQVAVA